MNDKKWFKRIRGSYLPISWEGWLTYIPFAAFLIGSIVIVSTGDNRIVYIIYTLLPQWVAAAVIMTWIASHKS